ncbi:MAG TPA: GAF domain-containing protein, partial [Kofleriaceae bacterium]|nr:GAF domain-containing protein [Kofleriaceae bacterium]
MSHVDTRSFESASPRKQGAAAPELLSGFLRQRRAEILAAWEQAVRTDPVTRGAARPVLADVVPELLDELAARPRAVRVQGAPPADADLAQVIAEYLLVRTAIAQAFAELVGGSLQLEALRCIDEAIDGAVAAFANRFAGQLRAASAHEADRLRFLAEATAALASSLDYDETLERVAQLAVPVLADWCVVDLVDDGGALRRVSVAHRDPGKLELVREWARRFPSDWVATRGVSEVIRTGEPELVAEIADELLVGASRDPADLGALRALGLASYLIVPLVARDRRLGAITLVSAESGRRYGAADVELARELARRAALAVDNARVYAEAQRAAHAR